MGKIINKLKKIILAKDINSFTRKILVKVYKNALYARIIRHKYSSIRRCDDLINAYEPELKNNKKEKKKLIKEMLYYRSIYGTTLDEYYMFDYRHSPESSALEYVNSKERKQILRYLNQNTALFTLNKYATYKIFSKYYKREMAYIRGMRDFNIFEDFCSKHKQFVKKPAASCQGMGVELLNIEGKDLKKVFKTLVIENASFIIEERIDQDDAMAVLHPQSVNTVRMLPYRDEKGKVIIHYPFLKVGQNSSFVDNGGAGGILAAINPKNGVVISDGIDELRNEYKVHPNTGVKFKGFQISKWDELVKMVTKLSDIRPEGRYLGWDVALSKKGWVVVECNSCTAFVGQQMPLKRGIRKEFVELINWENVPNKEKYLPKTNTKKKIKRNIFVRIKRKIGRILSNIAKNKAPKNKFAKNYYSNRLYNKYYKKEKKKIMKQINIYYKNHSEKDIKNCIKDMIYSKNTYGITYAEYFMFKFADKSHQERNSYISGKGRHAYLKYLNQNDFYHRFTDKYETYLLYQKYFKRDLIYLNSKDDFYKFEEFCIKHKVIVKKPVNSSLGKGIELLNTKGVDLNMLFNDLLEQHGEFILEEKIKQSKIMSSLHPESVNTIRVIPFMKKDGSIIIHHPFLKIGQNDSFVDNGGAGGILASIDANTGVVISDGIDEHMNVYKKHPNTKVKIKGFQIPDWDDVKKLAAKLLKENPSARYVGWDLAHTAKGWIVVEGNGKTMFVGQQMPMGKGIKKELEELIDWENVPNKEKFYEK